MNILFRGEIGDNQSWGISTIGNVQGFLALGHQVTLDLMNRYGNVPDDVEQCINRRLPYYEVFIRQGLAAHMKELSVVNRKLARVSLACWDSSLISEADAVTHNTFADGVIALSMFTRDAFRQAGVTIPIHVGGQGYDERLFYPEENARHEEFTFLTVAVAQGRKGTHALIRAFEEALGDVKGAKLVIKSNSWGNLKDYGTTAKNIHKVYAEYSREEMAELYRSADCFVLPTEGDSFALPGLEAMATGLPLVITDFGGPCDYCTSSTGYPVKCTIKEAGYLPGFQAIPDEDHLAFVMYEVFRNRVEARERGLLGAKIAKERWTWSHDAKRNSRFLAKLIEAKRAQ
jgi:glycosyltransferase involved in cell wall biosynthesis